MNAIVRWLVVLLAVGLAGGLPATEPGRGPAEAAPADLVINVRPEAVSKLIAAAVPYDLLLDVGVFEETIRLTDPRNVQFLEGGVQLQLTATGSPLSFETMVEPVIRLDREAQTGTYRVRIESLPVRIGLAGTYDLAALIPVIPIETVTEYLLQTRDKEIPMQLQVREIRLHPQGIEIKIQTRFP